MEKIVIVPKPIEEEAVVITPDLEETVVTFEALPGDQTRVAVTLVRSRTDDWQPNELRQSVYEGIFDSLVEFVSRG